MRRGQVGGLDTVPVLAVCRVVSGGSRVCFFFFFFLLDGVVSGSHVVGEFAVSSFFLVSSCLCPQPFNPDTFRDSL